MKIYTLRMEHYAQRGSEEGIYGCLVANSDEEVLDFICSQGMFCYENNSDDEFEVYDVDREWLKENLDVRERALKLNLTEIMEGYWEGSPREIALLKRSTENEDWSDLYYGKTHIWWDEGKEYSETDFETLNRYGLILSR